MLEAILTFDPVPSVLRTARFKRLEKVGGEDKAAEPGGEGCNLVVHLLDSALCWRSCGPLCSGLPGYCDTCILFIFSKFQLILENLDFHILVHYIS